MDFWLPEIFSGGALPLLYSLYLTPVALWGVGALLFSSALLSVVICITYKPPLRVSHWSDCAMQLTADILKLLLNISTLLAKAQTGDSDTGALLCIAPLFTLLSIPGSLSVSYSDIMLRATSATSIVLILFAVWLILTGSSTHYHHPPHTETSAFESCIQIAAAALCSFNLETNTWIQIQSSFRLAILQLILASSKSLLGILLFGSQNLLVWFLHGVVLLQSCLLLARSTRKQLGLLDVKDASRTAVLVNALLIAVAYAARNAIIQWAPAIGVVLVLLQAVKMF